MSKLDAICKEFNKTAKEEVAYMGVAQYDETFIPLSSPKANYALHGGIPLGRIVEFSGVEHGGKTSTAINLAGNAQKFFEQENPDNPRKVVFIDSENTFDPVWASKLGFDCTKALMVSPKDQTAEDLFNFALEVMKTGEVGLVILDSLASLMSKREYEKKVGEASVGGISVPLTRFSKEAAGVCKKYNCTFLGINQVRDKINSPYGGTTTPGGRAWKHECSIRMEFRPGDFFDHKGAKVASTSDGIVSNSVVFTIKKSKCFPNDRKTGSYTLHYYKGVLEIEDTIDLAILSGDIVQAGAWCKLIDKSTGEILETFQGRAKTAEYLQEHPDKLAEIKKSLEEFGK